jgi:hypothetical protein
MRRTDNAGRSSSFSALRLVGASRACIGGVKMWWMSNVYNDDKTSTYGRRQAVYIVMPRDTYDDDDDERIFNERHDRQVKPPGTGPEG